MSVSAAMLNQLVTTYEAALQSQGVAWIPQAFAQIPQTQIQYADRGEPHDQTLNFHVQSLGIMPSILTGELFREGYPLSETKLARDFTEMQKHITIADGRVLQMREHGATDEDIAKGARGMVSGDFTFDYWIQAAIMLAGVQHPKVDDMKLAMQAFDAYTAVLDSFSGYMPPLIQQIKLGMLEELPVETINALKEASDYEPDVDLLNHVRESQSMNWQIMLQMCSCRRDFEACELALYLGLGYCLGIGDYTRAANLWEIFFMQANNPDDLERAGWAHLKAAAASTASPDVLANHMSEVGKIMKQCSTRGREWMPFNRLFDQALSSLSR